MLNLLNKPLNASLATEAERNNHACAPLYSHLELDINDSMYCWSLFKRQDGYIYAYCSKNKVKRTISQFEKIRINGYAMTPKIVRH